MIDTNQADIVSAMENINNQRCWIQVLDDASGVDPAVAITNDEQGRTIPFITATQAEMDMEIEDDRADMPELLFRSVYASFNDNIVNVLNDNGEISYSYDWTVGRV